MTRPHLAAGALFCALVILTPAVAAAVPASLVEAIIRVESGGNPRVTGRHGEIGLMQIKCRTAKGIGFTGSCKSLYDAKTNRKWGTRYLDLAWQKAQGNYCHAASLYNMGIGARPRCTAYGRTVLRVMGR
jgi:soluble lytic murein transglycosylase-like protein